MSYSEMWDHPLYKDNEDLLQACECNNIRYSDIEDVLLEITGENDGADWHWIVETTFGCAYIHGGCDYTGWDCQSSAERFDADTFAECLRLVGQDERRVFEEMLDLDIVKTKNKG